MKVTAATLDVQKDLHVQIPPPVEPLFVRALRALVASHEFSLLMPDYDGATTSSGKTSRKRKARPDLLPKVPHSCSSGNPSAQGMSSSSEQ